MWNSNSLEAEVEEDILDPLRLQTPMGDLGFEWIAEFGRKDQSHQKGAG